MTNDRLNQLNAFHIAWLEKDPAAVSKGQRDDSAVIVELIGEVARLRAALEYGVKRMMPEIHAQRSLWPGEVDEFEDRARAALAEPGPVGSPKS